jgi:hypothetical protein
MKLSRLAKRIVAGVAGLVFVLSATAAAASACILSGVSPHDVTTAGLCPETGAKTSTSSEPNCFQERYSLQQATVDATKVAALGAVGLPPLAARSDQPIFPGFSAAAPASLSANAPPPPPHILYCRLRN